MQASRMSAASHAFAYELFENVAEREARLPIHRKCLSQVRSHGHRTAHSFVYFHGFTSCPAQGAALADQLFALGHNVYLPRMSGHGSAERLPMHELTGEHLVSFLGEALAIAGGLGERVSIIGLSAGGTLAAWAGQFAPNIDQIVLVSPFFAPFALPAWLRAPAADLTLRLPNAAMPWNPLANVVASDVDYPFATPSTHPLAEFMKLGRSVETAAQSGPPACRRISALLNAADFSVNNQVTLRILRLWSKHGGAFPAVTLPRRLKLPHDLINPHEIGGNPSLVYDRVISMLECD